jgi:hypothetical protein
MKIEWSGTDDRDDLKSSGMHGLIHSMDLQKMTYVPISSIVISGKRNRVPAADVIDLAWDAKSEYHPNIVKFIHRRPLPAYPVLQGGYALGAGVGGGKTNIYNKHLPKYDFNKTDHKLGGKTYTPNKNLYDMENWEGDGYDGFTFTPELRTLSSVLEFLEAYHEYRTIFPGTPEHIYSEVARDLDYKLVDSIEELHQ